jgi:YHS domain-containing protein
MNKYVRCEFCREEVSSEPCGLAAYETTIDGKKYTFCCSKCAQKYQQKKKH